MSDDFRDAVKSVKRIDREDKRAIQEMKNELYRVKKAYPKDKEIQEIVDMAEDFGLKPTPPRGPRTRKEHVKTNADKQRDYRQRQKEKGRRLRWAYDEKLEPVYGRVNIVIHKNSINICKKEPRLQMYLGKVLDILDGQIPPEVCKDMAEFFKVLGLKTHQEDAKPHPAF